MKIVWEVFKATNSNLYFVSSWGERVHKIQFVQIGVHVVASAVWSKNVILNEGTNNYINDTRISEKGFGKI